MEESRAEVSIVMPCYNAAEFIESSLERVFEVNDNGLKLELVIVDDGSTDDTAKRVESKLKESPYSSQIIRKSNGGPSSARNSGWRCSEGEWIQFLDCDDALHPDKIQLQLEKYCTIAKTSAADAVIYSQWVREQDPENLSFPRLSSDDLAAFIEAEGFVQLGAKLYHRAWLQSVGGFDESCRCIEDVHLDLRLAIAGGDFRAVDIGVPGVIYKSRPDSLSNRSKVEFMAGCVRNARLVERHWQASGHAMSALDRDLLMSIYDGAIRCFAVHDKARFNELVDHMMRLDRKWRPATGWVRRLCPLMGYRNASALVANVRSRTKGWKE